MEQKISTEKKRLKEEKMIHQMIRIYCRGHHGQRKGLCPDCQQLEDYALMRIKKCPFMETKTFCSACRVHCYRAEMRERIRQVMRYAGPRMLFVDPVAALHHAAVTLREKRKKDVS